MICPKCGSENPESGKFCNRCGAELAQANVCPKCGVENNEDARFCSNCGVELKLPEHETRPGAAADAAGRHDRHGPAERHAASGPFCLPSGDGPNRRCARDASVRLSGIRGR